MKSAFRLIFFLLVAASALSIVSCEPDTTNTPDPNDPRKDYVGVWTFNEHGKKSGKEVNISYIVSITYNPDNSSEVILNNFAGSGVDVYGTVTTNQVVVSSQTLNIGNNSQLIVQGSGKLQGTTTMSWNYNITIGGDIEYFTATATKQ